MRGIPEIRACGILMFMWSFGPDWHKQCQADKPILTGPQYLPIFWSHIPDSPTILDTS